MAIGIDAGEAELPLGKPAQQHPQHPPHQLHRRVMLAFPRLVVLGRTIQRNQNRQRPIARGKRELHQDRQYDPFAFGLGLSQQTTFNEGTNDLIEECVFVLDCFRLLASGAHPRNGT